MIGSLLAVSSGLLLLSLDCGLGPDLHYNSPNSKACNSLRKVINACLK